MDRQPQVKPLPSDVPAGIWFHGNACLALSLSDDMSLENVGLEGCCGKPSGDDVVRTRVCGNGVSPGLPDTGGEIVALRVWCTIPVHDELTIGDEH